MMRLVIHRSGRKFLTDKKEIVTEFGKIRVCEGKVKSSKGEEFTVTDPFFVDFLEKFRRGPQITHLKDLGLIAALTGLGPGWKVVDAGTGTGYATAFFANLVGENGHVYTYETNPKFYRLAKENLAKCGLTDRVTFHLKDVCDGIEEQNIDLVFFDLPEPWTAFKHAEKALKPGGFLVCYLPSTEQVKKTMEEIKNYEFTEFEIYETFFREWKKVPLRPKNTGLLHTAFILISRRL